MSRQLSRDEIADFYHMLHTIAQSPDGELALMTLQTCFPKENTDETGIKELLIQYHDNDATFKPIIDQDRAELLEYLYNINPSIITFPIEKGGVITLSNLAMHGIYPRIMTWLKEKKLDFFARPESTEKWAEQALAHLEDDNYHEFLELLDKLTTHEAEKFFQSADGKKFLEEAYDHTNPDYFIALIESHIETYPNILRIKVHGKSILNIFHEEPETYKELLDIVLDDDYLDNLTEEEHTLLQSLSLNFYRKSPPYKNFTLYNEEAPKKSMLTNNEFSYLMFGISGEAVLSETDKGMLKQYIDPRFWPDLSALEAFLHKYFFEKLSQINMPLHPIVANHTPIQPEQLIQLAQGDPILYITDLTFENGETIPSLNLKAVAHHVERVIIPINHQSEGHYGILILDLTQIADGTWKPGKRNYFIEPYSAERETIDIHNRLAQAISLLMAPSEILPIKVIRLGQKDNSSCSDYVIATIMNAVLHNDEFIEQIQNKFLDESVIMKIRLVMIVALGFDYFKLQLPSWITKDESVLKKVFDHLSEIVSQWKTPREAPSSAEQKVYPYINLQRYNKYGNYLETGKFVNAEHRITALGKPQKKLPMNNYKRPGSPPTNSRSKRQPETTKHTSSQGFFRIPPPLNLPHTQPARCIPSKSPTAPAAAASTFSYRQDDCQTWQQQFDLLAALHPCIPMTEDPLTGVPLTGVPLTGVPLTGVPLTEAPPTENSTRHDTDTTDIWIHNISM